ncbi:MAG TPA: hypothetical protein PLM53_10695 [Spirochaetota bacterium]|nr:hypothetical protein [Spirochaetota bacterium]HQH97557.1 hypothetical protein [Spirochaetota bacterium]
MSFRFMLILVAVSSLAFFPARLFPEQETAKQNSLPLDKKFFVEFVRIPLIMRDDFIENRLNTVVLARGVVTSIEKNISLKKKYRVIIRDTEAERLNIKVTYHLYVDSTVTISMLQENKNLEFSGQLIAYTPTSSKRDAYILDIMFEKGAVIIE